jgi:predicted metal-dependent phosphoesterase TrpH
MKSPAQLLNIVRSKKLSAFAVTDHDTFAGSHEMRTLMNDEDPRLITGIELSAGVPGEDLHLLVYFPNHETIAEDSRLAIEVAEFQRRRATRGDRMVQQLQEHGIEVTVEQVQEIADGSPVGRPHVADALLQSGAIKNYDEAFRKWIGYGKPGYVAKDNITPEAAIELAHDAGGVILMAHPGVNHAGDRIEALVELGLDGVEVLHPGNDRAQQKRYRKLAKQFGLVISGGSDYHGRNDHHGEVGQMNVPSQFLEEIIERAARYS